MQTSPFHYRVDVSQLSDTRFDPPIVGHFFQQLTVALSVHQNKPNFTQSKFNSTSAGWLNIVQICGKALEIHEFSQARCRDTSFYTP